MGEFENEKMWKFENVEIRRCDDYCIRTVQLKYIMISPYPLGSDRAG
jgi:hypothetical protein